MERRSAVTMQQTGNRGQPGILLRRRLRDFARLRFSHRFRNLPLCLARAEAWPNSRLWWFGALAEDHRYHANQRHRNAITADPRPAGTRLGYCNRMRSRNKLEAATDALVE